MADPALRPLGELLRSITEQEDSDEAYIIAGTFNLYYEAIRRQGGRSFISGEDIFKILSIIRTLLAASVVEQNARELTGAPRRHVT